jgi:trimeric autotransporter adhesin
MPIFNGDDLNNTIAGAELDDVINGFGGDDILSGWAGNDTLNGGLGNDLLYSGAGEQETLNGNEGDDKLYASSARALLDGGSGNDIFFLADLGLAGEQSSIADDSGIDTVDFRDTVSAVTGSLEQGGLGGLFTGSALITMSGQIENFIGSAGNDVVDGNDLANVMIDNIQNEALPTDIDTLSGGLGNDTLINSFGADRLYGDIRPAPISDSLDTEYALLAYPILEAIVEAKEGSEGTTARISGSFMLILPSGAFQPDIGFVDGAASFTLTVRVGGQPVSFISNGATVTSVQWSRTNGGFDDLYPSFAFDYIVLGMDPSADDLVTVTIESEANFAQASLDYFGELELTLNFDDTNYAGGDDVLDGGAVSSGGATLIGGLGNDTYIIRDLGDIVHENGAEGTDTVQTDIAGYVLPFAVENLTLLGTANIDATGDAAVNVLTGNTGNNILDGREGADLMRGNGGADTYMVDHAADQIVEALDAAIDVAITRVSYVLGANVERLELFAGAGAINGTGNALNNTIIGNESDNVLTGGLGNDTMAGGLGNDTYVVVETGDVVQEFNGPAGVDTVVASRNYVLGGFVENLTLAGLALSGTGNGLNNILKGNNLANVLSGSTGNDTLDGGAGADALDGGAGNDVLVGGTGIDNLAGGAGNDTYVVDSLAEVVTETTGIDTIQTALSFSLAGHALIENLTLTGAASVSGTGNALNNAIQGNGGANLLRGGDGNDTMWGEFGHDTLLGEGGNDRLFGGQGNDILDGGLGVDRLEGGLGNDTYRLESVDAVLETDPLGGVDTVETQVTYALGAFLENLKLMGTANISGTGNDNVNTITGNSGDNRLDGKAGPDTMAGGAGNDTYIVDSVGETLTEGANAGTDTVQSSIDFTLGNHLENLTLTGGATFGTGNTLANRIVGTSGANVLDGKLGADILTGGAGADRFVFSTLQNLADTITDFRPGLDKISISAMAFGPGLMSGLPIQFTSANGGLPAATGTAPQLLYNNTTDELFFDRNGTGAGGLFLIAIVQTGALTLTANDFEVVAP